MDNKRTRNRDKLRARKSASHISAAKPLSPCFRAAIPQGQTREEALANIREAITLWQEVGDENAALC